MRSEVPAVIWMNEKSRAWTTVAVVGLGVLWLALLAQVKVALPWTPVPITGQTFGVAVLALTFGSRLSMVSFLTYLLVGFAGAPVFAGLQAGLSWGPTMGYLVGMFFSAQAIGFLSDRGWGRSFGKALAACYLGSLLTFGFGLLVLSQFVPSQALLAAGLIPFLPGDLLKNLIAATIVSRIK
jgi:biotin transport system substrate-specific component